MSKLGSLLAIVALFLSAGPLLAQANKKPAPKAPAKPAPQKSTHPNVFTRSLPGGMVSETSKKVAGLFRENKFAEAEKLLLEAIAKPDATAVDFFNLACAQSKLNKKDEALKHLAAAFDKGFSKVSVLKEDPDLINLHGDPRYAEIVRRAEERIEKLERPTPPAPALVDGDVALVAPENTAWDERRDLFLVAFRLPENGKRRTAPAVVGNGAVGEKIRKWQAEGAAAGLYGILYDNQDRDHSLLKVKDFPQLTSVEYCADAKAISLDHGVQTRLLFNLPTIGNSSTAIVSQPFWRSQPRYAQASRHMMAIQYAQYSYNHLYFYPEHRDYDPGRNGAKVGDDSGFGDVFLANTPYVVISQGSSGSDRPFMNAFACTLAAFTPQTQQKLIEKRILAPTLQMIFRRANKQVQSDDDYLAGKAHPPVFQAEQIDLDRMVQLAHDMPADQIPPAVQLLVVEEDEPKPGVDFFDNIATEKLFDTPGAIARIYRSTARERRIVVSAEKSFDVNGRPLTFHWALLQGQSDGVQITPLNEQKSVVEIRVRWHERFPIAPGSKMESNRVDIGAFVHNGAYYSAPAFISFYFPDCEKRIYNDQGKIASVEYRSRAAGGNYVDPLIYAWRDWRDEYHYDAAGTLTGWTRIRKNAREEFAANGELILERDAQGKPTKTRAVRYRAAQKAPTQAPVLEQVVVDDPAAG